MLVMAFDIGIKNFAVACVEVHQDPARTWSLRFMDNSNLEDVVQDRVGELREQRGAVPAVRGAVSAVRGGVRMQTMEGVQWAVYRALILHLDTMSRWFEQSPTILIEQQMSSKHKSNIKALRLSQHLLAYLLIRYPSLNIVEFSPRHKTQKTGVKMTYSQRKKYAVDTVVQQLEVQGDEVGKEWMMQWKKRDDVADCILMCLVHAGLMET